MSSATELPPPASTVIVAAMRQSAQRERDALGVQRNDDARAGLRQRAHDARRVDARRGA